MLLYYVWMCDVFLVASDTCVWTWQHTTYHKVMCGDVSLTTVLADNNDDDLIVCIVVASHTIMAFQVCNLQVMECVWVFFCRGNLQGRPTRLSHSSASILRPTDSRRCDVVSVLVAWLSKNSWTLSRGEFILLSPEVNESVAVIIGACKGCSASVHFSRWTARSSHFDSTSKTGTLVCHIWQKCRCQADFKCVCIWRLE